MTEPKPQPEFIVAGGLARDARECVTPERLTRATSQFEIYDMGDRMSGYSYLLWRPGFDYRKSDPDIPKAIIFPVEFHGRRGYVVPTAGLVEFRLEE